MRERVKVKSPVRENRTPGSVRGAPGNRCPYLDERKIQNPRADAKCLSEALFLAPRDALSSHGGGFRIGNQDLVIRFGSSAKLIPKC